jgi:hypothetical protein
VVESPEEMDTLRRIRRDPANYYVNIHTQTFPDGAVRGQVAGGRHRSRGGSGAFTGSDR